jgi:hypothetical protein
MTKKYVEEAQMKKGDKEERMGKKKTKYGRYKCMYSMLPGLFVGY